MILKSIYQSIAVYSWGAIFFVLTSCEQKKTAPTHSKSKNFPSQVLYKADIVQRDSGLVKLKFKAPIVEKYEFIDSPYVVAKKGIYLETFDKKDTLGPNKVWADFAIYYEEKDFYEAKGNVKILTSQGTSFLTQSIFWNKKQQKMYTSDTVRVIDNKGNIHIGANGMIAKDDFSEYVFMNNTGTYNSKQISHH